MWLIMVTVHGTNNMIFTSLRCYKTKLILHINDPVLTQQADITLQHSTDNIGPTQLQVMQLQTFADGGEIKLKN